MTNTSLKLRLESLEKAITGAKLDLYVVPMVDEFQGEYIPAYAARLPYVTGFTGSAGMGVFWGKPDGKQRSTLFVDGRYILQAPQEVDTARIDVVNSGDVSFAAWLANLAGKQVRIGLDPWLVTMKQYAQWSKQANVEWVATRPNLVDSIWDDQPLPPAGAVKLHPLEFAGQSYADKRAAITALLKAQDADAVILTLPDAINWLLNIRGDDIPFNPLMLSYLLLKRDGQAVLYSYGHELGDDVKAYFAEQNVTLADIREIFDGACAVLGNGSRVLLDSSSAPYGLQVLGESLGWEMLDGEDPTQLPKACKNAVELDGIRAAHVRDGLALTKFLHWFDRRIGNGSLPEELAVVAKLEEFRAADNAYRGPSFATIAGSGPNGAIIHYRADEASNRKARSGELFLLDSGGQYADGTTDVTRTLAVGPVGAGMKRHFTLVLKGHIALAAVEFPFGTSGIQLDVLARQYLWQAGLDFDHGTGHGVGAYLCVHEGPQRISKRGSMVPLQPGMIISNEPGYYAADEYGIRIESLVAVVERKKNGRTMLAFETLTLAPIDVQLIDVGMLESHERNWLNQYHRRVYDAHASHLNGDALKWLTQVTRAI